MAISPRTTFSNWGASSRLVARSTAPRRVRRGSRVKVGFVSTFFREGTAGRYFEHWITDLPRDTFEQQPEATFGAMRVAIPQWASAEPVVPLARIEVGPEDFPLLSQIPVLGVLFGTHGDDEEEIEGAVFIIPSVVESVPKSSYDIVKEAMAQYSDYSGDLSDVNAFQKTPPIPESEEAPKAK